MALLLGALWGITERTLIKRAGEKEVLDLMETLRQEKAIPGIEALHTWPLLYVSDTAEGLVETSADEVFPAKRAVWPAMVLLSVCTCSCEAGM